jgi:hypothetical protein
VKGADLVVSMLGMPFMAKAEIGAEKLLLLDAKGSNLMAPNSYVAGLKLLAAELSRRFPKNKQQIMAHMEKAIGEITDHANALEDKIRQSGVLSMPVIAASMQKEQLEWMGFRIVGEYGRPEAISAKEIVPLSQIGRDQPSSSILPRSHARSSSRRIRNARALSKNCSAY